MSKTTHTTKLLEGYDEKSEKEEYVEKDQNRGEVVFTNPIVFLTGDDGANKVTPYFFRNYFFGKDVYLVQSASSLEEAYYISDTWSKQKFNPISSDFNRGQLEIIEVRDHVLFLYSEGRVKQIIKGQNISNKSPRILKYKSGNNNGKVFNYASLLPF